MKTIQTVDESGCCVPLTTEGLDETEAAELALTFKALADPARVRLLSLIANAPESEACVCDLIAPLERSQATVSHHLAKLKGLGLVRMQERHHRIEDVFREGGAGSVQPA